MAVNGIPIGKVKFSLGSIIAGNPDGGPIEGGEPLSVFLYRNGKEGWEVASSFGVSGWITVILKRPVA